jgi:glycosyltransferase involved in cell wall biosynthesis
LLARCLASVTRQPGSWECIVVDDGSTDDTRAVVSRFPGVIYTWQPNAGPSAARNTGLAMATGEWIAFMDSDDEYLPSAFAVLERVIAANPQARVVCGGITGTMRIDRARAMDGSTTVRDAFAEFLGFALVRPRLQLISAAFHRDVFAACGTFATAYSSAEDREFLVRVAARFPVTIVRVFVARYHEGHGDGKSDRSLVDGTKLQVLRQILSDLERDAVVKARLDTRLRDAHLDVLDVVHALRDEDVPRARAHLSRAIARCRTDSEREALVFRLAYLITYPATDQRAAAERAARWLDALALHDVSVGVRLWSALILARAGSWRVAAAVALPTLRSPGRLVAVLRRVRNT